MAKGRSLLVGDRYIWASRIEHQGYSRRHSDYRRRSSRMFADDLVSTKKSLGTTTAERFTEEVDVACNRRVCAASNPSTGDRIPSPSCAV